MRIATTQAHGISTQQTPMTDRTARGAAIARNITQNTTGDQAVSLLREMRDGLRGRDGLVRLVHTTKTRGDRMEFESFNKRWGQSTRTLETKAALIAHFEAAGWDTTELNDYLGNIMNREHRIQGDRIFQILDNAVKANGAEWENAEPALSNAPGQFHFNPALSEIPWSENNVLNAPELGGGGMAKTYSMNFNGEKVAVKIFDKFKLPPPISLDPQRSSARIKRDQEVTAAFIKEDLPSVAKPTHFIVQITEGPNRREVLVKAGKDFKTWSVNQLWDEESNTQRSNCPEIKIIGLAMPLVEGQTLDNVVSSVPFRKLAESTFTALTQLANHGFVHGDIKSANMIVSDEIRLIDTGSMAKISKNLNHLIAAKDDFFNKGTRPTTPEFTHPGYSPDFQTLGMEQDLFSAGVMLLNAKLLAIADHLESQGLSDEASDFRDTSNTILNHIGDVNRNRDDVEGPPANSILTEINGQLAPLRADYSNYFRDGEADWALRCVNTALARTTPATNRDDWKNLLNQLVGTLP